MSFLFWLLAWLLEKIRPSKPLTPEQEEALDTGEGDDPVVM